VQNAVFASKKKLPSAQPLFNQELNTIFHSQRRNVKITQGKNTKMIFMTLRVAVINSQNLGKEKPVHDI
jgi:hypothetical protein